MKNPKSMSMNDLPYSMGEVAAPKALGSSGITGTMRMNAALEAAAQDSPLVAAKKATVTGQSDAKKALLGSPEGARKVATAFIDGNSMAQEQDVQDMLTLDPIAYAAKYGFEAAGNQGALGEAVRGVRDTKSLERSTGDAVQDAALGATVGGVNVLGGAAAFGAGAVDAALGTTMSPYVSLAQAWAGEKLKEQQSEALKERRKMHQIEAELAGEDTEKAYQEALARGDNTAVAWLKKQGSSVADVIGNYAEDPMMLGDLAAEGAGSLAAIVGTVGLGGATTGARGASLVPGIVGITEGGAAVAQTQQQIMGMDEKALMEESAPYKKMRQAGVSHEQARLTLARDAGIMAGATALPGAVLAGKIASKFEANPFAVGGGVKGALGTVAKETGEEFLQEGNTQLMSNIALDQSAKIETDWDKGVVEAGTTGALGGAMVAGGLQAPGLGAKMAAGATKAVKGGVGTVIDKRLNAAENAAEKAAGVDLGSRVSAALTMNELAASMPTLPTPAPVVAPVSGGSTPAPAATDPVDTGRDLVTKRIQSAARLSPEEQDFYASDYDTLGQKRAQDPSAEITRTDVIFASEALVTDKKAAPAVRAVAALTSLTLLDDMRKLGGDDVLAAVQALPEGDAARVTHSAVLEASQKILGSRAIVAAEEMIAEMTPELANAIVPVDLMQTGTQEEKDKVLQMIGIIARINPTAVGRQPVEKALNQLKGRSKSADPETEQKLVQLEQDLSFAQESIQLFEEVDAERAKIQADYDSVVEGMDAGSRDKGWKSFDTVRQEIRTASNQNNGLPSLQSHYRQVTRALAAGNIKQAERAAQALKNFAQHQTNKVEAYNKHAQGGMSRQQRVPFEAYGPFGWFTDEKGVYTDATSPRAVAMAQETHADMKAATRLYNTMAGRIELARGEIKGKGMPRLKAPKLASSLAPSVETQDTTKQGKKARGSTKGTEQAAVVKPVAPAQEKPVGVDTSTSTDGAKVSDSNRGNGQGKNDLPKGREKAPEAVPATGDLLPAGEPVGRAAVDGVDVTGDAREPSGSLTTPEPSDAATQKKMTSGQAWMESLKGMLATGSKGVNYFLKNFKARANEGTTLLASGNVREDLEENINNLVTDENLLQWELNEDEQVAVLSVVREGIPKFMEHMNKVLNETANKQSGDNNAGSVAGNFFDKITRAKKNTKAKTTDPLLFAEMVVANFAYMDETTKKLTFDENVMAATYMAALEWVIQNQNTRGHNLNTEEVNKALGLPRSWSGGERGALKKMAMFGSILQPTAEQISSKIEVLLGVQADRDVSVLETQGLMKSLAVNALEYLAGDVGMLEVKRDRLETNTIPKDFISFRVTEKAKELPMVRDLADLREPFTKIFTNSRVKDRYIGKAPIRVNQTQLGNPLSRISKDGEKVLSRLNNSAYRVNLSMLDTMDALGREGWLDLMGHRNLSEAAFARMNENTALSIRGVNNGLVRGYEETMAYVREATIYGEEMGQDLDKVEIFFDHSISAVGRIQQEGPVTPQGDKTAREIISPTISTISLENEDQVNVLWLALAQSVGLKVEKQPHATVSLPAAGKSMGERLAGIREEAESLFTSDWGLGPAVFMMRQHVIGRETLDSKEFIKALRAARDKPGKAGKELEITSKLVHAVRVAAELDVALEEEASEFTTGLALEADGKTDGPINAIIHMGTGDYAVTKSMNDGGFTAEDVERMAKGGLFFTGRQMSLNDFYLEAYTKDRAAGTASKLGEDLYHNGARRFGTKLNKMVENSKRGNVLKDFPEYRVLGRLLKGFDLDGGIDRGVVKNPLTVFLYGSSVAGIAGKIASEVAEEFYQIVTDAMAAKASGKINRLLDHPGFGEKASLINDIGKMMLGSGNGRDLATRLLEDPAKFSFRTHEMEALIREIERSFAQPMAEAIDEVTGGLQSNMLLVQVASQLQALVFKDRLNRMLKDAQEKKGELLSQNEMESIFASLMRIAPIYSTGGEAFQIAGMRPKGLTDYTVSTTMTKQFRTNASGISAKEASVKASPYLTMGTGDGQMIMNIYLNGDGMLEASLPVFDGVELGVANASAASEQINEAVFEGWTGQNTYQAVADGLKQLLATVDGNTLPNLSPETKKELMKTLKQLLPKGAKSKAVTLGDLGWILYELEERAMVSQARKNAIRRMATQTDHMAGAKQPHGRGGVTLEVDDPTNFEAVADQLNALYKEELDLLAKKEDRAAAKKDGYAEKESPAFKAALEKSVAEPVEGYTGVFKLEGKDMVAFMKKITGMSGEQAMLYLDVLRNNPQIRAATYFFGPADQLQKLKADRYAGQVEQGPIELGQSFPNQGLAFIANLSPETLLHEMLHVATRTRLEAYFTNRAAAPENVQIAAKNLQNLVKEVRALTLEDEAVQVLQEQLELYRNEPANQISELISYALTNQNLIRVGKDKTSYGPMFNVIRKGLHWFKKMLGIKSDPGSTVFSNIRFNTEVLLRDMREAPPKAPVVEQASTDVESALNQVFGEDARLSQIERVFGERLKTFIDSTRLGAEPVADLIEGGKAIVDTARSNGFAMNAREATAARTVFTAVSSGMALDPAMTRQIGQIYDAFMEKMTAKGLLEAEGNANPTQAELDQASEMLAYLGSNEGVVSGTTKKADHLAVFVSLAAVNPTIRAGLDTMQMPKLRDMEWNSADNWIRSIGKALMNLIMRLSVNRPNQPVAVRRRLDELTMQLGSIQAENKAMVWNRQAQQYAEKANDLAANYVEKGSKKLTSMIEGAQDKFGNDKTKGAAWAAKLVTSLGSKEMSTANGEALTRMMNDASGWDSVRALLRDVRGATASNKDLLKMLNVVKYASDSVRQRYRESIPEVLAKKFSRKLEAKAWEEMHQGFGETDILSLGLAEGMEVIRDPGKVAGKIAAEQAKLANLAGKFAPKMEAKAKALAVFVVRKEVTSRMLLRNAAAIARLGGENRSPSVAKALEDMQGPDLERAISRLTSLMAYDMLDPKVKENLARLAETEKDGVESVVATLRATRQSEIQQKTTDVARANGWKGHVPVVTEEGQSIRVLDDLTDGANAIAMGYTRVGDYTGDIHDDIGTKRGYYRSDVGGKAAFKQGIAKAVHQSYLGADTNSGLSMEGYTADAIFASDADFITKEILAKPRSIDGLTPGEYLLPVLNRNFEVVAYERPIAPKHYRSLKKDAHLGRMMGVWMGRIVEEQQALESNRDLLKMLKEKWDSAPVLGREKGFVNVAKSGDPIIKDAWDTLGWNIKEDAEEIFGKKGFVPVRKDMVDDAIGFRAASLTDHWTGISRISDKNRERVRGLATAMMGNKAYRIAKKVEGNVQEAVSYAKTTIVVRSVLVAYENIVSNVFHLSMLGVSLPEIVRLGRQKFIETTQFVENQGKIRELEVELARLVGKPTEKAKTEGRIAALKEANAKMSIAPLIEAGEFSTVSENLTEADVAIRGGRWADYIERATDKLPGWTPALAKNLLITKDTALFQGLNRMIQYGDFVAKAVLYEHMTKVENKSQEEALETILEEFVQYNRLAGRGRDNLESWGLLWFYNYKLRIMKIALKAFREKPLSALLMNAWAPGVGVDTAYSGSLPGAGLDGRLNYSFGPEMGLNSITMNPWFSLTR